MNNSTKKSSLFFGILSCRDTEIRNHGDTSQLTVRSCYSNNTEQDCIGVFQNFVKKGFPLRKN
jgi:hypothetical protein